MGKMVGHVVMLVTGLVEATPGLVVLVLAGLRLLRRYRRKAQD